MPRGLPDDRLEGLLGSHAGLSAAQAQERRLRYGPNDILQERQSPWLVIAANTAADPMVWFLLAAAGLFGWLGEAAEAAALGLAIVPVIGMDAFLHWRTHASTEGLRRQLASHAIVLRDGVECHMPASELVPGDLVNLRSGDWAPADGFVETGDRLQVDESSLTGEAMPVRKTTLATLPADLSRIADDSRVFAGTRLLAGSASLRIAFTGRETVYGQIASAARREGREMTPLQRAITRLVGALLVIALVACVLLAVTRLIQGHGPVDAFISAATLGVAALPEEFPVVFSFFLALGVFRLARQRALVRRAVAVENIGRVTCICADKTGTLTEGRLRLREIAPAAGHTRDDVLRAAARAARAGSEDPLDRVLAENAPDPDAEIVATFPFTEARRRETIIRRQEGRLVASVKGAPETVLRLSQASAGERAAWIEQVHQLAASGCKVIACASRIMEEPVAGEPDSGFVFTGLLAFEDPLRDDAIAAVAAARDAGIRVVVLTGDHSSTARAIAGRLKLGGGAPSVVEAADLTDRDEKGCLASVDVIARATPAQKLDIVQRLRRRGEIVAVTGDGVNDAPALRAADVSIAMGQRGAQTSTEIASIVLLDDRLSTIVHAIAEGRQLFQNLRLSFAYLLVVHGSLVATAAIVPFMGGPLLYLPLHIVWLELVFHPTALLAFQDTPRGQGRDRRIGERASRSFFNPAQWALIAASAALASGLALAIYQKGLADGLGASYARSSAIAMLVFSSGAIAAGLSGLRTRAAWAIVALTLASVFVLVEIPVIAELCQLRPLAPADLAAAGLCACLIGALASRLPHLRTAKLPGKTESGSPVPG